MSRFVITALNPINHTVIIKWTSRTGFGGVSLILLGILVSALFYVGRSGEGYSFYNHFVSELGEVGVSELAIAFNGGLVAGAALLTCFLLGIARLVDNWLCWLLGPLALVTGVSGLLVGVFPMSNLIPHIKVALTFFNTGQFTVLLFSVAVLFSRCPWFSRKLAIPGFITLAFFILFLNMPKPLDGDSALETDAINHLSDFQDAMLSVLENRPAIIPLAIFEWLIIGGLMAWILSISLHLSRYQRISRQTNKARLPPDANT